jgi:SnoaL-like polyketide cyclase
MADTRADRWAAIEGGADKRSPREGRYTPPRDFVVSVKARRSRDLRAADQGERVQPMRGYEDTYVDIVDYVIRVTDRIWEDQDVGYIHDTYRAACRVYDDSGPRYGVETVVEQTIQAINAFPDTRHYADDIIWAGNEDEGFATSHRAVNVGHHTGPWRWGPPTGHKIHLWVIANCVSEENQFYEEWVLHNVSARLAQCRIDVRTAAREYGNEGLSLPLGDRELTEIERLRGGRKPELYAPSSDRGGFDVEHIVRALFHDTYNRRDLSAIDRAYAANVRWHGATTGKVMVAPTCGRWRATCCRRSPTSGCTSTRFTGWATNGRGLPSPPAGPRLERIAGSGSTAGQRDGGFTSGGSRSCTSPTDGSWRSGRYSTSSTCSRSCSATNRTCSRPIARDPDR